MEQLRDNDRFSLVMFDDKAVRLTPLIRMSPENKIITNKAIESVKPDGGFILEFSYFISLGQISIWECSLLCKFWLSVDNKM